MLKKIEEIANTLPIACTKLFIDNFQEKMTKKYNNTGTLTVIDIMHMAKLNSINVDSYELLNKKIKKILIN